MARRRMIDPDIWQDEKFSTLDFPGRLFFIGLISQANDYGKLRGNPRLLKSLIFPYEENSLKIEKYIKELTQLKMIITYEANQEKFIKIKNWNKYQVLMHPSKDTIPEPSREFLEEILKPSSEPQRSLISLSKDSLKEVSISKGKIKNGEITVKEPLSSLSPSILFNKETKSFINITESDKKLWKESYPACDIDQELKKMVCWLIANPTKTKSNYRRFINSWLSRSQDSGGTKGGTNDKNRGSNAHKGSTTVYSLGEEVE